MCPASRIVVPARCFLTLSSWSDSDTAPSPCAGTQACANSGGVDRSNAGNASTEDMRYRRMADMMTPRVGDQEFFACFVRAVMAFSISSRYLSRPSDALSRHLNAGFGVLPFDAKSI